MNQHPPISDRNPAICRTGQHGCVFILSNKFDNNSRIHEEYADEMRHLWGDEIGCQLFRDKIHLDLSKHEIKEAFRDLSTMDGASQFDYLVVVINAKGSLLSEQNRRWANRNGGIFYRPVNWLYKRFNLGMEFSPYIMGSDRKWYSESKMLASFFNDNDKWKGKPKLFILNYCRTAKTSDGYAANTVKRQISKGKNPMFLFRDGRGRDTSHRIPTISDFTVVFGSSSRLVSDIKNVFSDQWKLRSISQMLTTVNDKMRNQRCWSVFESSQESAFMLNTDRTLDPASLEENLSADNREVQTINRLVAEEVRGRTDITTDDIAVLVTNIITRIPQETARYARGSRATLSKGCALLICNVITSRDNSHEWDQTEMENLWANANNRLCDLFEGNSYLNRSGEEMQNLCDRFSTFPSACYEYAVIIISSHGGLRTVQSGSDPIQRQCIAGHKEGFLCERELLNLFNRPESTWHNKVKIFILDYCRGGVKDRGVAKATGFSGPSTFVRQPSHVEYQYNQHELPPSISTVVDDCIIVYATHSPYKAYSYGLINAISDVFQRNYLNKSIMEMLTMVNARMKQGKEKIAMSLFTSTLTDDYHILPMQEAMNNN